MNKATLPRDQRELAMTVARIIGANSAAAGALRELEKVESDGKRASLYLDRGVWMLAYTESKK